MLLVAERDDDLRHELIGQLLADGYQARPARTTNETRCRAGHGPDLLLLGERDDPTGALRLLRELRSGDALAARPDPALPVIVLTRDAGEWAPLRALEAGADDRVHRSVSYLELRARGRSFAARGTRTRARRTASARWRSTRTGRRSTSQADESTWPATSTCCSPTWPPTPSACSQSANCCARSGATATSEPPGRSTRTPAGCARSSNRRARRGYVVNRRGVGYQLIERVPATDDQAQPVAVSPNGSGSLVELAGARRAA
jgi:CheY-like chemotaxis protein